MASTSSPEKASLRVRPLLPRLLLAVSAPAVFFCGLEAALRLGGFGVPTEFFIPDSEPGVYRTNPGFTAPFIPASFGIRPLNFRIRRHKAPGTVRVFVLGESAAQGMPDPDFGFAAQLGAQLRARFPAKSPEVFNLGITAINSHVVYRIARQVAAFEPDLFVIYMGNNEVVGPYGPGCAYLSATPPLWFIRASAWVRGTRTGQLVGRLWAATGLSAARARDWKGMETFSDNAVRGDDPRLEAVYRNFSANLQDIADLARRAGIRTVLSTLVANLKDNAPFISLHRAGLSAGDADAWKAASGAGMIAWDLGDAKTAGYRFGEALRIDPEFAEIQFRQGVVAQELGDPVLARKSFLDALHWDALRFRPDTRVNEIIRRTAAGAPGPLLLVDAARELGSDPDSASPPAGREILLDHVHFNWDGNFRMGRLMADGCARELFAAQEPSGAALDRAGCAAALGYTPDARLTMLRVLVQLTLRPPFSSQITFSADQAWLKREIERTDSDLGGPGAAAANIAAVKRALDGDPGNAALALRLGAMESEAGDPAAALALVERAEGLLPRSAEMSRRRAQVLVRLKRHDEAEALLLGSLEERDDYFASGGALGDLWTATGQFGKGRRFFAGQLEKHPANPYLRLEYANLLVRAGDGKGAEGEARMIWDADPGSRPAMAALELLVRLFEQQGRSGDADALTLEARAAQPGDYFNNERLVRLYTAKGDAAEVAACLMALAASGPFDAAQHLDLAHRLSDLNRAQEMLDELARARDVARIEGGGPRLQAIGDVIGVYRRRFSGEKSR